MKPVHCKSFVKIACLLTGLVSWSASAASDVDDLTTMLNEFLGAAHEETAHRRFWADDLVYTSSNGTRFGKAEILQGLAEADPADETAVVIYSAEDIDVRVYGTVAVVAFRLVGTPSDSPDILEYYNTGTFLKRDGSWRVVAWQATSISDAADPAD